MFYFKILMGVLLWVFVPETAASSSVCPEINYHVRPAPNLQKKLQEIKLDCGEICDTNMLPTRKGKYYDFIKKKVDCVALFESKSLDQTLMEDALEGDEYTPPKFCELSQSLRNQFTYNKRVKVKDIFIKQETSFILVALLHSVVASYEWKNKYFVAFNLTVL